MSRFATEAGLLRLNSDDCAIRARLLRDRRRASTADPIRLRMLRLMEDAYLAFGLAKMHEEFGSDRAPGLKVFGYQKLSEARSGILA